MDVLVNVVVPVFGIILSGYLAGRWNVLGADSAVALNRFVYYFALPPLLFAFTARASVAKVLYWPFIGAFIGGALLTLLVALVVGRLWFRHDLEKLSLYGLTSVFANTAYMGVPLFLTAFGPEGVLPAIVATITAFTLLIGGTLATLETSRAPGPSVLHIVGQVTRVLVRNPLLVAPFAGLACSALALPIPKALGNYLDLLAAAAGPAALFALGLSLVAQKLGGDMIEVSWLVLVKLIVHPAMTWLLVTYVFDMPPLWSKAAIILAALPVGALVFVIAQQYDVYVRRASTAIVVSTALSVATISLLLIVLGVG